MAKNLTQMIKGTKVLLFEDNLELLELCTLILEDMGCEVITSPTSDKAVDQVRHHKPHLIFMDNWLPNVSGVEATQSLKAEDDLKHIPVIYFSANNNIEKLAKEAGANDFLAKPFNISALEMMVKKYALNLSEE